MEDIELSEAARALFEAPFGVLAHQFHEDGPPTFVYANQASPLLPHFSHDKRF